MGPRFIFKYLLIFTMIICGNSENPLFEIDEQRSGLCTQDAEMIWRFAWRYFENRMHAVAILANKDSSIVLSNELMRCSMQNAQLSVLYFATVWKARILKRRLNPFEVFYRHYMNGLILIKQSSENFLPLLSQIDQEAKVIVYLMNATVGEVADFLKLSWNQCNILDLIVFHTINTTKRMQGPTTDLYASILDPFVIKNGIRGFVHVFKIRKDDSLISKLLKVLNKRWINFHGYPLKVITEDKTTYENDLCFNPNCGIVKTIVRALNFDPLYYDVESTGEFFEIEDERADISARVNLFYYYGQHNSVYLFPLDFQEHSFIVPKMQPGSTVSFLEVFTPKASIALVFTYITVVIMWSWLQRAYLKYKGNNDRQLDFMEICCVLFGNFLLVPQPSCGEQRYERCLFISWICFSMLICFHYQATMVEHLSAGGPSRDINTLEEVIGSGLKLVLLASFKIGQKLLEDGERFPQYYRDLIENSDNIPDENGYITIANRVAKDRDAAMMCDIETCKEFKVASPRLVHVLQESFFGRYSAPMVPLNSPYKERFNEILMKVLESGLISKWRADRASYVKGYYSNRQRHHLDPRNDVYIMKDLLLIFWFWLGCCCFCFLIFHGELMWAQHVNAKEKEAELRRRQIRDYVNEKYYQAK